MSYLAEGKLSETIESQRLECVCGKKLRIPANASAKARAGKCPKCQAPFEFRDGAWVCVAVGVSHSTAPKPEKVLLGASPVADLASIAAPSCESNQVVHEISPATAAPLQVNDKPFSHSRSDESIVPSDCCKLTEYRAVQPNEDCSARECSKPDVIDEEPRNSRVSVNAEPWAMERMPVRKGVEGPYSHSGIGSELAKHQIPETAQTDHLHVGDQAANVPSEIVNNSDDQPEQAVAKFNWPPNIEQELTSLRQAEVDLVNVPSTFEPSCEPNASGHFSVPEADESQERDRLSQPVNESFAPAITPELAEDHVADTHISALPSIDIPRTELCTAVDDFQPEQTHSPTGGFLIHDEGAANAHVGINKKIRASLATALGLDSHYPANVVAAITLACHPWPDCTMSQCEIDSIAAELRPGFNINHPSIMEIAIDRLLRFEDALQFDSSIELAAMFTNAALTIESYHGENAGDLEDHRTSGENIPLIASPIGLGTSEYFSASALENNPTQTGDDEWHSTIISLLGSAVFRGSRDTGLALGSEETGVSVSRLAEQLGVELPEKQFDEYLDTRDERVLDILQSRTFRLGLSDTLVDIAARWKITRERVRQIETKASEKLRDRFTETFRRLGKQSLATLSCHVFRLDLLQEIATRIAGYSRHREILSGFLADIFGPWHKAGPWIYHSLLQDRVEQLRISLNEQADDYGAIDSTSIISECEGLFLSEADRDQFLKEEFGFGNYFESWTNKNTMRCQVAAALRKIGRPATKDELAELLQHPLQSVGSILGNIEGIVRADRYRWGFDEWIDDAYDGIYGEIEQRINEHNGAVPVHILMREIPSQFGVAESSVEAYLASSAFVVENGIVRMASNDEYVAVSPSRCAAAIRIGEKWGYRSLIYDRHFNGYSLGVNFDVAYANGLRPGDDLLVPVDGCDSQASLIWRSRNLNRLVDVGRIADFLLAKDYKAGETLILIPSRDKIEIIHERDLHERYPELKIAHQRSLFGCENQCIDNEGNVEFHDPLFDLLGNDQ